MDKKILKLLVLMILLVSYSYILLHKINLTTEDLGRHIKNGQYTLKNRTVLHENFYSYTRPHHTFVNHHWLSGFIFYTLFSAAGFHGLTIFKTVLYLLTFAITFKLASEKGSFWIGAALSIPILFLLSYRTTIRPEIFSYLFTVLFIYILSNHKQGSKKIWLIPLIMVLWVNLHIYFFVGLFIILAFLLERIRKGKYKTLLIILLVSVIACLCNPNFTQGALYPLNILQDYGYETVENKTIFFMENLTMNISIPIFKLMAFLLAISFIASYNRIHVSHVLISIFALTVAFFAIRNLTLFGFLSLPIISYNLEKSRKRLVKNHGQAGTYITIAVISFLVIASIGFAYTYPRIEQYEPGLGIGDKSMDSIQFFKEHNLTGPIFNNYDIGSYLIFHLFPQQRVFVDNRPEAYGETFFSNIYLPMQLNKTMWRMLDEKFKFNTIYFTTNEATYWGQTFLSQRFQHPKWALVYVGKHALILVRRTKNNTKVINKFEITSNNSEDRLNHMINSNNIEDRLTAANVLEKLGRAGITSSLYENILEEDPDNYRALTSLGFMYSSFNDPLYKKKSIKFLKSAIQAGYVLPKLYNQIGINYFYLKEYDLAEQYWRKGLRADPENKAARSYLEQSKNLAGK